MNEQEQFLAIGRAVLSLVPEQERAQFQQWLLDTQEDAYVAMADRLQMLLSDWDETSWWRMDKGL